MYTSLNPIPCQSCSEHRPPPMQHAPINLCQWQRTERGSLHPCRPLPSCTDSQLTVFLVSQLQNHVLLSQLMVGLLQVFDVINGFSQDSRLVHLQGIKTHRKQFVLRASRVTLAHRDTTTLHITEGIQTAGCRGTPGMSKRKWIVGHVLRQSIPLWKTHKDWATELESLYLRSFNIFIKIVQWKLINIPITTVHVLTSVRNSLLKVS